MIFLGLDIGSSSCKCVAFSESGASLAESSMEYPTHLGKSLSDAENLFSYVSSVISACASKVSSRDAIASITVVSFGESFIPVDKNGGALASIGMYTEGSGIEEVEFLRRELPSIPQISGVSPNPLYALPRMMRLIRTQPEITDKLWKFLQIADYVIFRLCGQAVLDYSLACRSMAFDITDLRWSEDILSVSGLDSGMLSDTVPAGAVAGEIHKSVAQQLGVPLGTKIVVGAHDQVSAATGTGALVTGDAVVGTGTVECIIPIFDGIITDPSFAEQNYVCIPHAVPEKYVTYAFTISGGSLLAWYRDHIVPHLKPVAQEKNCSVYDLLNDSFPHDSTPVITIPHFGGTGTPELKSSAFGTISGLSLDTGLPEIYRAILEGLCFEMCYNREQIRRFDITFSSLRATGGGARSSQWLQLKSDILGIPVSSLEITDSGAVGGAMMAAVSLGAFKSLSEAAEVFVKIKKTFMPDSDKSSYYTEKYQRYKYLRQASLNSF